MISSITISGITFHLYGLIIGVAVAVAYTMTKKLTGRLYPQGEITRHDIDQSFWWLVGGGLIGARLYHVIDYWAYYAKHFVEIPAVWRGGLGIYGAIAGGIAGAMVWSRRRRKLLCLIDVVAVNLPLSQAMGRWGNFINQEIYGWPTTLPWGVYIDPTHRFTGYEMSAYYHPLFLYEMVWSLVGWGLLWRLGINRKLITGKGNYGLVYLFWYALGRTLLEPLKLSPLESSKVMAISVGVVIMIATGFVYLYRRKQHEWAVLAD